MPENGMRVAEAASPAEAAHLAPLRLASAPPRGAGRRGKKGPARFEERSDVLKKKHI